MGHTRWRATKVQWRAIGIICAISATALANGWKGTYGDEAEVVEQLIEMGMTEADARAKAPTMIRECKALIEQVHPGLRDGRYSWDCTKATPIVGGEPANCFGDVCKAGKQRWEPDKDQLAKWLADEKYQESTCECECGKQKVAVYTLTLKYKPAPNAAVSTLEGLHRGKTCSIKKGFLVDTDPQTPPVKLKFKKREGGAVTVGGVAYDYELTIVHLVDEGGRQVEKTKGPFPAKTDPNNPIDSGTHNVEIADYPHDTNPAYGDKSKVWFRIGNDGDRYVHAGRVSAGCLTCAPAHWNEIYSLIANERKGDGTSIGTLEVS